MKKDDLRKTNKGKSWEWSHNPHGVIKTSNKWTLLAVECYIRRECEGCIYWKYCRRNFYEEYPIMKQVVAELCSLLGKPPRRLINTAIKYYYYNYLSNEDEFS